MTKAQQHGIIVNFDGWEVIAESNYDTTELGVGFVTEEELASIVQEVLSLGVELISEEQFGDGYIQTIQSVCSQMGAGHETTTVLWWQSGLASLVADMQLGNVFTFYPYSQAEVDSVIAAGHGHSFPANLGLLHIITESCKYFDVPTSIAVGSFGTLETENWRNVLLYTQLQHLPDRFSIEETNTGFLIWDPGFNFMDYVGNELLLAADMSVGERPIVNLVLDVSWLYSPSFIPAWFAVLIDAAAIVNTFTSQGYRVVSTVDSLLPDAHVYYLLLAGGASFPDIAELPDYVLPLLEDSGVVILQPTFGIPDESDGADWLPVRDLFGLPGGETQTIGDAIPESLMFEGSDVRWGGVSLYLTPCLEWLPSSQIDTAFASVVLSGLVDDTDVALVIKNGDKYLVNSNLINIEASFILSTLLSGRMNGPAAADIVITDDKAMIFAEHDTQIDVDLPWSGITRLMKYDSQGGLVLDQDTNLSGTFSAPMLRGDLAVLVGNFAFECGDADATDNVDIDDVVYAINYIFGDGPEPVPYESGDADCSGDIDIDDAVYLINYIFSGGNAPCDTDGDGVPDC